MSAISHGFSVHEFQYMTIGMVLDALSETIPDGDRRVKATKEDIKRLL